MNAKLIYVAGPTGVGKTALSRALAKHYKTEIVSCDSRQFYKEMKIGTAVPSAEELASVPHHFIQYESVTNPVSVGEYEKQALEKLKTLFEKHERIILTGGSGLFAQALMEGLDEFPDIPDEVKMQLRVFHQTHGLHGLQELLRDQDPTHYRNVDRQNPLRLMRALEVCFASGAPYSSFLGKSKAKRSFDSQVIVLHQPREILYDRINQRLRTVGYQEWWDYFAGKNDKEATILETKRNTRRYAKRQITWFNRYGKEVLFPANMPIDDFIKHLG